MALDITHASVIGDQVIHATGSLAFERHIRAGQDGWVISSTPIGSETDLGPWPQETQDPAGPLGTFRPTLLQFPTLELTRAGDFKAADDLVAFAARVTHDAQAASRARAPAGTRTQELMNQAAHGAQVEFAPAVIANEVSETYGLETAMWIGATLQQGVQYELLAPLPLAGLPPLVIFHQLEFSFTREVPCTTESTGHSCVELIVRASPQQEPLKEILADLQLPHGEALSYSSASTVRIITDPATLRLYLHETREYWYATLGRQLPRSMLLESEHSVITSTYR